MIAQRFQVNVSLLNLPSVLNLDVEFDTPRACRETGRRRIFFVCARLLSKSGEDIKLLLFNNK